MKPLFDKPLGCIEDIGLDVDNCRSGTPCAVTCQLCGTQHPELDECGSESHHTGIIFGRQVVLECCGIAYNILYKELGQYFADAKLQELAKDPTSNPFFLSRILMSMKKADEVNSKTGESIKEVISDVEKILQEKL